ncbi:MAG: preprotein translocase subunit SecG [Firmicutes bacterium ADurb.Bin456]|nr:MAG: preprotein translocase subunit SecG [Firmicutes bacterium ADurb.Bin456]
MAVAKVVFMVFHVLLALALIAAVVLQSGKSAGLSGSIAGGAETLFGGKKKGLDELLSKVTVIVASLFAATALLLVLWK